MIIIRILLSYYTYKDYSEMAYWELKRMNHQYPKHYEDTPSLKKTLKNCLHEIFESNQKKISEKETAKMSLITQKSEY